MVLAKDIHHALLSDNLSLCKLMSQADHQFYHDEGNPFSSMRPAQIPGQDGLSRVRVSVSRAREREGEGERERERESITSNVRQCY
jgi:hypothetical protein